MEYDTPEQRLAGARLGGTARHRNVRRELAARELIADVAPSIGDHSACDPATPASLCAECAELLVVPATAADWDAWRDGRLG